jgi:hypothetical protein
MESELNSPLEGGTERERNQQQNSNLAIHADPSRMSDVVSAPKEKLMEIGGKR